MSDVQSLKNAVRARDPKLAKAAYDGLRKELSDRQCYRLALAADPELTPEAWADLVSPRSRDQTGRRLNF